VTDTRKPFGHYSRFEPTIEDAPLSRNPNCNNIIGRFGPRVNLRALCPARLIRVMPPGIRTSTTSDWPPNAGIAPSSDRTAPGRTSRFSAADRSHAGNAWCPGLSKESRGARHRDPGDGSPQPQHTASEKAPLLAKNARNGAPTSDFECVLELSRRSGEFSPPTKSSR
jgi:hypothetical protein